MKKIWKFLLGIDCLLLCLFAGKAAEERTMQYTAVMQIGEAAEDLTKKKIALTFDDGPHPQFTEQLLDGLKERKLQATFFVTGEHAKLHPDIIERIHKEGHVLGNHTYSHIQLTTGNREQFKQELIKTNEILTNITGEEVLYVRPPYGVWDKNIERELNMFPVLWSVDPLDWKTESADVVVERVLKNVKEYDIILLHDASESTVNAALEIVDKLQKKGYEFVTVDEILFD